jgi:pre-60S factor REI1
MASTTIFPCNTCSITFSTSASQRSHMRSPWHVSNLHRRIAGEPALLEDEFKDKLPRIQKPLHRSLSIELDSPNSGKRQRTEEKEEAPSTTQRLFCPTSSPSTPESIEHMASTHGLFIPQVNHMVYMESFLEYLGTIVFKYHSCLYCSTAKGSLEAVRTHMKDKGHCMVRMEDVTAFRDDEQVGELRGNDMKREWKLPSGAIITSKSNETPFKPGSARSRRGKEGNTITSRTNAPTGTLDVPRQDTQLTSRNAHLSLSGVSASSIRSLQRCEKRNKTIQALAEKTCRKKMEQAPVLTKYYKTENPVYQAG